MDGEEDIETQFRLAVDPLQRDKAMALALHPRRFPGREQALRVLMDLGVDFNKPVHGNGGYIPVYLAVRHLKTADFQLFLDVVRPDVTVGWSAWDSVLTCALYGDMLSDDGFGNACVLIDFVPPAMLTQKSRSGKTPLQHILQQMAQVDACDAQGRLIKERWDHLAKLVTDAEAVP